MTHFFMVDETTGSGMVLRDHMGAIIFRACRHLLHCSNVLESGLAAIRAIREEMSLA